MDYVVNIEAMVPIDPDRAAEALMDALELEDDTLASVHAHPEQPWCLMAFVVDTEDVFEAIERSNEMLREAWVTAFDEAALPQGAITRVFTMRTAEDRHLVIPERPEETEEEAETDEEHELA